MRALQVASCLPDSSIELVCRECSFGKSSFCAVSTFLVGEHRLFFVLCPLLEREACTQRVCLAWAKCAFRMPLCCRCPTPPFSPVLSLRLCVVLNVCFLSSVWSVYSGHQSILIPPSELEVNPALWLLAVSQFRVRDTFCSYSVMELCTKGLGLQTESLKVQFIRS